MFIKRQIRSIVVPLSSEITARAFIGEVADMALNKKNF